MSTERLYPIIALALLAAATLWLARVSELPEPQVSIERTDPDFIGEHIRTTNFDAKGLPLYELQAEHVVHYPHSDITDFTEPRLHYRLEDGDVRVRADTGESSAEGEIIVLNGNVRVVRQQDGKPDPFILEGSTLTVWPDTQQARSDEPVVLRQGATIAHGNAMRADNLAGTVVLIGESRVQMPPQRN